MPPDTAVVQLAPAPLWRRLAAGVYDLLPVAALLFIGTALAMVIAYVIKPVDRVDLVMRQGLPHFLLQIWLLFLLVGYYAWSWHKGGQTIGMKAWRLEVLSEQGGRLGLGKSILRLVLSWVSFAAVGAGFVWSMFEREGRTWHDLGSSSQMVLRPKVAKPRK